VQAELEGSLLLGGETDGDGVLARHGLQARRKREEDLEPLDGRGRVQLDARLDVVALDRALASERQPEAERRRAGRRKPQSEHARERRGQGRELGTAEG
jgi:hypothetical protein